MSQFNIYDAVVMNYQIQNTDVRQEEGENEQEFSFQSIQSNLTKANQKIKKFELLYDALSHRNLYLFLEHLNDESAKKVLNLRYNGNTLLHLSVIQGNIQCVRALLDRGANMDVVNELGKTPEDIARENQNMEILSEFRGRRSIG